jgi:hypothetical protein
MLEHHDEDKRFVHVLQVKQKRMPVTRTNAAIEARAM